MRGSLHRGGWPRGGGIRCRIGGIPPRAVSQPEGALSFVITVVLTTSSDGSPPAIHRLTRRWAVHENGSLPLVAALPQTNRKDQTQMIIRGFAALVISAVLGIGTLVVVNNASNDANETAKEISRQSLEYQKQAMKDADAQSKAVQEGVNKSIEQAGKDAAANSKQIQDDVSAQIDAATDQIAAATK